MRRGKISKKFENDKDLKKYLTDHPDADKSNHSVKKTTKGKKTKQKAEDYITPDGEGFHKKDVIKEKVEKTLKVKKSSHPCESGHACECGGVCKTSDDNFLRRTSSVSFEARLAIEDSLVDSVIASMDGYDWEREVDDVFYNVFSNSESEGSDHRVDFRDGSSIWLRNGKEVEGTLARRHKAKMDKLIKKLKLTNYVEYV